ncbi:MAG TPA: zf-HC2 domain-containing protein [Longimicrobiales bacterium]|nr:zf-HC2 domain-containing protein [Longimicrobiales bacterium]
MSHVDEGRLHAFLDGALSAADPADAERVELHLAACADCRAKLDEAARLRDEAAALLGVAQPRAFAMPLFDAIRARADEIAAADAADGSDPGGTDGRGDARPLTARSGRNRRAFFASPFNGFAWAATIVLAVGLGWLLRDTSLDSDLRPMTDISGRPVQVSVPASADADGDGDAEARALASTGAAAAQPAEEPLERIAASEAPLAPRTQSVGPPDATPRPTTERAEYDVAPDEAAGADISIEQYAVEEDAAEVRSSRRPAEEMPMLAGEPVGERQAAATPPARRMAPPAAQPPAAAADAMVGAAAAERPVDGWRTIAPADADRVAEGELVVIPGARITAAATRGSGPYLEVRTVQRTSRGETIEVLQRRVVDDEALGLESANRAEASLDEAAPTRTVRRGNWTVTISGAVDDDRLKELLDDLP